MNLYYHFSCVAYVCQHVCQCMWRPKVVGRSHLPRLFYVTIEAHPSMQGSQIQLSQLVPVIPSPSAFLSWNYRQVPMPAQHLIFDSGDLKLNL